MAWHHIHVCVLHRVFLDNQSINLLCCCSHLWHNSSIWGRGCYGISPSGIIQVVWAALSRNASTVPHLLIQRPNSLSAFCPTGGPDIVTYHFTSSNVTATWRGDKASNPPSFHKSSKTTTSTISLLPIPLPIVQHDSVTLNTFQPSTLSRATIRFIPPHHFHSHDKDPYPPTSRSRR